MTRSAVHFLVPGRLDQRTGGYLYDARMIEEMRSAGLTVRTHELEGAFPDPDTRAREALSAALRGASDGAVVIVDGLAGGGLPDVLMEHATRLQLVALVHHPLAEETGLTQDAVARFTVSERAALAACRGVVVTSAFTASRLRSYGVTPCRVRVAPPGTEPAEPALGPGPDAPPRLLCVASLTARKGHFVLLDALHRVRDLAWTCAFAGSEQLDAPHATAVRHRVEELELCDRISLMGELDSESLQREYAGTTLFVLASHYEGYGMALTEAMARSLPVLSTTGGAIPYTVPAEAGVLVEPGDVEALAGALRTLVRDEDGLLSRLRTGAARVAAELPDWTTAGQAFVTAVEEAAAEALPPFQEMEVAT